MRIVTLQPIAMVTPTAEDIYAPSRISKSKQISYVEFLAKYSDHPRPIMVSFAPDGKSNPQPTTAYGVGMDCWYIVADHVEMVRVVAPLKSEEK